MFLAFAIVWNKVFFLLQLYGLKVFLAPTLVGINHRLSTVLLHGYNIGGFFEGILVKNLNCMITLSREVDTSTAETTLIEASAEPHEGHEHITPPYSLCSLMEESLQTCRLVKDKIFHTNAAPPLLLYEWLHSLSLL